MTESSFTCPHCLKEAQITALHEAVKAPKEDDATVCAHCTMVARFDGKTWVLMTPEDYDHMPPDRQTLLRFILQEVIDHQRSCR